MIDIRKKLFVITISIVLVVLALVVYFFVFKTKESDDFVPMLVQTEIELLNEINNSNIVEKKDDFLPIIVSTISVDPGEVYAKQIASIFVERFLSYSNQNNNQHIEDVLSLVTVNMSRWVELQRVQKSNDYNGVTTFVIASSLDKYTENSAVVLVDVQQILESVGSNEVVQKSGKVNLIKQSNDWKVSGFFWE